MRRPSIPRLVTVGALALIALLPAAACGSEPVSPLPIRSGAATPSQPASAPTVVSTPQANAPPEVRNPPANQRPKTQRPQTSTPPPTTSTSTCRGAERYDIDLQNTELALHTSMCFATGGVLRLQGIGPGLVTVEPDSLVARSYEGGVVDIRFLHPGTVTVTIPQNEQDHTIAVVIR